MTLLFGPLISLQSLRDAIGNQVSGAFLLYEQNLDTLATYTERSAVAPSIAWSGFRMRGITVINSILSVSLYYCTITNAAQ